MTEPRNTRWVRQYPGQLRAHVARLLVDLQNVRQNATAAQAQMNGTYNLLHGELYTMQDLLDLPDDPSGSSTANR
jgi:hypothetical protein